MNNNLYVSVERMKAVIEHHQRLERPREEFLAYLLYDISNFVPTINPIEIIERRMQKA